METPTKRLMIEAKSVADQFNYIYAEAGSLFKVVKDYEKELDKTWL